MADMDEQAVAALRKKRQFKKFLFRGLETSQLLDLTQEQLLSLVNARARRRLQRGTKRKSLSLLKKLRKAKEACGPLDKPEPIKTHLRDMIIVPEMIHSTVAVHNGKVFNLVEIKPEMVGLYLAEFSITYRPVRHGRPGMNNQAQQKFMPV
jgi:small subunit ribosomal protein S15e